MPTPIISGALTSIHGISLNAIFAPFTDTEQVFDSTPSKFGPVPRDHVFFSISAPSITTLDLLQANCSVTEALRYSINTEILSNNLRIMSVLGSKAQIADSHRRGLDKANALFQIDEIRHLIVENCGVDTVVNISKTCASLINLPCEWTAAVLRSMKAHMAPDGLSQTFDKIMSCLESSTNSSPAKYSVGGVALAYYMMGRPNGLWTWHPEDFVVHVADFGDFEATFQRVSEAFMSYQDVTISVLSTSRPLGLDTSQVTENDIKVSFPVLDMQGSFIGRKGFVLRHVADLTVPLRYSSTALCNAIIVWTINTTSIYSLYPGLLTMKKVNKFCPMLDLSGTGQCVALGPHELSSIVRFISIGVRTVLYWKYNWPGCDTSSCPRVERVLGDCFTFHTSMSGTGMRYYRWRNIDWAMYQNPLHWDKICESYIDKTGSPTCRISAGACSSHDDMSKLKVNGPETFMNTPANALAHVFDFMVHQKIELELRNGRQPPKFFDPDGFISLIYNMHKARASNPAADTTNLVLNVEETVHSDVLMMDNRTSTGQSQHGTGSGITLRGLESDWNPQPLSFTGYQLP